MKLGNYLEGKDFWGAVRSVEPFAFILNVEQMNMMLLNMGYSRTLFSRFEGAEIEALANQVVMFYRDHWNNLIKIADAEMDILEGNARVVREEIDVTEVRTDEREDLNKVSAYNDDELLTDTGTNSKGGNDLDGKTVRKLFDGRSDLETAYNNLSISQKHSIIRTVLQDVINFLSLSIY